MNEFRVEKRAVEASIYFTDGSTIDGRLFLAEVASTHRGGQNIEDLMAESGRMIPFAGDAGFVLVGTSRIVAILVPNEPHEDLGFFERVPARVVTSGGTLFTGKLLVEAGAGRRVSDMVNAPGEWLQIEIDHRMAWIAKQHVNTISVDD